MARVLSYGDKLGPQSSHLTRARKVVLGSSNVASVSGAAREGQDGSRLLLCLERMFLPGLFREISR
jgi:hypothetical protein